MPDTNNPEVKQDDNAKGNKPNTKSPLVFISHDTRDAALAEAFSKLLSSASIGMLKSFRSSDKTGTQGIEYGVEWYPEIMKKLDTASDVVALLTPNSVDRPWILYEAGVAKGKLNTPLLGVAIGIPLNKANNGPFAQFQNSDDDLESLTKLVIQLIKRIPNAAPPEDTVRMHVENFRKQAEEILAIQPKPEIKKNELMEDSSVAKLFEEIKIMFQDLPMRIDRNMNSSTKKRLRKIHPRMIEELAYNTELQENGSISFLIVISFIKDDLPWLYDIGKEVYEKLNSKSSTQEKEKALIEFRSIITSLHHSVFIKAFSDKRDYIFVEEMTYFIESFINRFLATRLHSKNDK